ncbi:L-histidine N(alpha)-methyltransferase [Chrysosporum bergii ANA360D]|uniref:L-histidine N(Alpha)-methyltransferase n=1 Tax=Chrysosporum bergii ANA360D TaxID=617107 RepID=A0AA43GPC4_9CYAN|nr:L-histidine N(alpha)-methyltransferase [Chrysosporum bergii]MDH6059333.1 L-histidine N(alpha)-methyltransferase [Chrysosporum bergii ANA360D]
MSQQFHYSMTAIAKPSPEFYSVFSPTEVLELMEALKLYREIPLKYSYKGTGAKIWNKFYQNHVIAKWYQKPNVEVELLQQNFLYINGSYQKVAKVNIVDVGAGNSYPVKGILAQLHKLGKINQYIALDISQELLSISQANIKKWFPSLKIHTHRVDIEKQTIPLDILTTSSDDEINHIANIFLHLGVTIGNHQNRNKALQNLKNSMNQLDLLIFTNEIGSNSTWNQDPRGGCKYHVEGIYKWIQESLGIKPEHCQLVRKYDFETDSITASIKFKKNYTISFSQLDMEYNVEFSQNEEITIWRHHKYQLPELIQDIEKAGLQVVDYSRSGNLSHIMVICKVAS